MMKKVLSASIAAAMVVASSASVFAATNYYEKGEFGNSVKTYYYNAYRETNGYNNDNYSDSTYQEALRIQESITSAVTSYTTDANRAYTGTDGALNKDNANATVDNARSAALDFLRRAKSIMEDALRVRTLDKDSRLGTDAQILLDKVQGADRYRAFDAFTSVKDIAAELNRLVPNNAESIVTNAVQSMVTSIKNRDGSGTDSKADENRAQYAYNRDVLKEAIRQAEKLADWNTSYGYAAEYSTSAKAAFDAEIARAKNILKVKGEDETTKGVSDPYNSYSDTVKPTDDRAVKDEYEDKIQDMETEVAAIISEAIRLIQSRFTEARLEAEKTSNSNTANWRTLNQVIIDQQAKVDKITRTDVSAKYESNYYLSRGERTANTLYSLDYDKAVKEAVYVVDAAVRAVQVQTGRVVTMTDLKTEIDRAEKLSKMDFTNDYFALFDEMTKVLADSKAVYNKNNATQTEVDGATSKLKSALDKLVVNDDIQVRLKSILNKIAKLNPHDFSAQSWAALQNAVNAAKVFYKGSLTDAYAPDTDAALALLALEQALDALVPSTSSSAADTSSTPTTPTTPAPKVPKTGDTTPFAATAMLLVIAAAGATVIVRKNSLTK